VVSIFQLAFKPSPIGGDSFSSFLEKHGPYESLILQGSGWCGNDAKFQTESLPARC
jgi:hypothetical protein